MTTEQQTKITVEHQPSPERLEALGVANWSIWTKEASEFPWTYDMQEICYILAGEVTVTPDHGEAVNLGKGDLVTFPAGMSCTWNITKDIRKHYSFS